MLTKLRLRRRYRLGFVQQHRLGRSNRAPQHRGLYGLGIDRRLFLRGAIVAGAGGAVLPTLSMATAGAQTAEPGESPYGPLSDRPDQNGLHLPDGFTSRIIAVSGEQVSGTSYVWHPFPDGAATFPTDDGGWIHACNSEVRPSQAPDAGGVSAVSFSADGTVSAAYRILEGSSSNCAGGPTPWGTWLSGEEYDEGQIWECDPTGDNEAVAHPAMGRFSHEAAAVDPKGKAVYLTEDQPDGLLYRYTPTRYPDLTDGSLEAAVVADDGAVTWLEVPDPAAKDQPTRKQVAGTPFAGGEGIWHNDGFVYFTTKFDHSVHSLDLTAERHQLIWKGDPEKLGVEGAVLSHVDNITVDAGTGDLYVAEDGGNMELVIITPEGSVAPFARVADQDGSEVTGPCFNPARDRLYFSSQRGPSSKTLAEILPGADSDSRDIGITFEVTGPFRGREQSGSTTTTSPVTTIAKAADGNGATGSSGGDDGSSAVPYVVGGVAIAAAAAGGLVALRRRRSATAAVPGAIDPATDADASPGPGSAPPA